MKVSESLSTVFGIGRAPFAPGTVASAFALVIGWPIAVIGGRGYLLLAGIVVAAIGAWASELYVRDMKEPDPSECVIDEVCGQWIALAFAPVSWVAYVVAFVLFRVFDIVKPWPISRLERLPGGLGVMADDLGAAVATGILVAALAHARVI